MLGLASPYTCPYSLPTRVLGLPQRIEIDSLILARQEIQARLSGGPCYCWAGGTRTTGSLAPSLTGWRCGWGMVSLFLYGMNVCPGFPGGLAVKNPLANATDMV